VSNALGRPELPHVVVTPPTSACRPGMPQQGSMSRLIRPGSINVTGMPKGFSSAARTLLNASAADLEAT
jgi:hypothetical protein